MSRIGHTAAITVALLLASMAPAEAQGRGQGQGGEQPRGAQAQQANRDKSQQAKPADRGKSQQAKPADRGKSQQAKAGNRDKPQQARAANREKPPKARTTKLASRPVRLERMPQRMQSLARGTEPSGRAAAVAIARGHDFGELPVNYLRTGEGYRVVNRRNDVLFDLSDEEARRLGYWDIRRLDPNGVREGAPAFCRSGAGHPVWGREWCIDKGFGLGSSDGWLWGRHRPDDVIFGRVDERTRLDRGGLIDVLGSIIFNRLAVHALSNGLADPLAGQWLGEPAGPRVLTLSAGPVPVAELVDWNRDGTVDVMYVVSRD